ncbi:hypothetical protein NL457_29825, partial [Klebsiella pneumoniae]|nr:hypothetical protein [Klebsiella pneumoniae]
PLRELHRCTWGIEIENMFNYLFSVSQTHNAYGSNRKVHKMHIDFPHRILDATLKNAAGT